MEVDGLDTVCAGLGFLSQDSSPSYVKSDHCLENLKNLQRFLRRDHPTSRPVFKQLGNWNTVGRDLVPIISQYRDDPELIVNAVKVIVFLTMPVDALSENVSQQLDYLLEFKACFLHNDAIAVIMTLLEEPLEHLESQTFSEDDWKVVQLVLTLMRNLVDIQDFSFQKIAANESIQVLSVRDKLLEHLFEENVLDLLLALAQHISGPMGLLRQDSILFLEIFHHIFWGQSPDVIARAHGLKKSDRREQQPAWLLRTITKEEKEQLKDLRLKELSRHSRFSGSFVQLAEDGSKRMLRRNPFQSSIDSVLRRPQVKHGPVKRIACNTTFLESEEKILELLKSFADQVLLGSYNLLMQCLKDDIKRERSWIQTTDVALFFEVANFFTAYQRCRINVKSDLKKESVVSSPDNDLDGLFQGQLCGPIASTMDHDMFMMVVSRWHAYSEGAKEANDWTSLSVASSLFKQMVRMLDLVLKVAKDKSLSYQQEMRVTRILLYKVFYDQTEQGTFRFLLHLVRSFDIHKQPRSHLADLVETVHVVLRTIEVLTNEDGALRVLKKSRKYKKRKKQLETLENMSTDVNVVSSDTTVAQEECLDENEHIRQSASESHGGVEYPNTRINDSEPQHEILTTVHTEIEDLETAFKEQDKDAIEDSSILEGKTHIRTEPGVDTEDDSGNEGLASHVEVSLNVQKCAAMFADNTVIRNYCWLLRFFRTNTAAINHYIICMLQRICKDHSLEPMLYQLSLFQIFYEILSNKKASKLEEHKRVFSFLTKLTHNFFKKLKVQPLLFLDVLFWKTRQDCHLITIDYSIHSLKKTFEKPSKVIMKQSIADALGNDEGAEEIQANHVEDGINSHVAMEGSIAPQKQRKRGKITQEQEAQLLELFEQHKENRKCCQLLAQEIDPEGTITAAHVRRRLKALNLSPLLQRRRIKKCSNFEEEPTDATTTKNAPSKRQRKKTSAKKNMKSSDDETLSQLRGDPTDATTKNAPSKRQRKNTSAERNVAVESSEDETLSQLMERLHGSRRRFNNEMGEQEKAAHNDSEETLLNHLNNRKRVRKQNGVAVNINSSSSKAAEIENQKHDSYADAYAEGNHLHADVSESEEMDLEQPSKRELSFNKDDVDPSLEDDMEGLASPGTAMPSSSSSLSPALAGRRRRALFFVEDEDM